MPPFSITFLTGAVLPALKLDRESDHIYPSNLGIHRTKCAFDFFDPTRLLNSTSLGEVIDEWQLHRHRTRAGTRIGDGMPSDNRAVQSSGSDHSTAISAVSPRDEYYESDGEKVKILEQHRHRIGRRGSADTKD